MTFKDFVEKVKAFEGYRETAYKDAAGIWTIGYGRTLGVKGGMSTNRATEDAWLESYLNNLKKTVSAYMSGYQLNHNQLLALTDFAFNLGTNRLNNLTANKTRSISVIASKILLYNKVAGKVNKGLQERRQWEHDLFLTPILKNTTIGFNSLSWEDSAFIFKDENGNAYKITYVEFKKAYQQFQKELKG